MIEALFEHYLELLERDPLNVVAHNLWLLNMINQIEGETE